MYQGKADAETEKRRANAGVSLASFTDGNCIQDYRRASGKSAKREAALRTLRDIKEHASWNLGSRLGSFGTSLKSQLVQNGTDAYFKAASEATFGYDPVAKPTSRAPLIPHLPCSLRYYGVCVGDDFQERATIGTFNLYSALLRDGALKSLPVLISIEVDGGTEEHRVPLRGQDLWQGKHSLIGAC